MEIWTPLSGGKNSSTTPTEAFNMVELARKQLKTNSKKPFIKHQVHKPESEDKSGLICSGEQIHAFIPLNKLHFDSIQQIIGCINSGNNGILNITELQFDFLLHAESDEAISYQYIDDANWKYSEQIGLKNTLYIFGGGHVSVPLSQIARMLEFKIEVYDNRQNLSTLEENNFAHNKTFVNYADIAHYVTEGKNSFAVIMTAGHKADELVLKQLVTKNLKYLGMIGSKTKTKTIFENLLNKGIKQEDLDKVDAPIGLSINSQTPAEIAVSIAAKIVQERNC
jgi:xanthine dehydrogenase accessory factor